MQIPIVQFPTIGLTQIPTEGLTDWERTIKYFPAMAKKGYSFATNIYNDLNPRRYKNAKVIDPDAVYEIEGVKYREVKKVVVNGYKPRDICGKVWHDGYPVFVKLEPIE